MTGVQTCALPISACYGSSPALVRLGLGSSGLPVLGATVSVGASLLVLGATLLRPGQVGFVLGNVNFGDGMRRKEGEWYDTPLNWLLLGSVTIASAQLFRYLALGAMDVTVASPLIASNAVFTLFFGWIMNRQTESFSKNVIMGVVMSMIGSVVLVVPIGV